MFVTLWRARQQVQQQQQQLEHFKTNKDPFDPIECRSYR